MKKLVYYIGILVYTGIFLSSCIKEDLSDCPIDGIIPSFILVPYEGNNIINDSLYSAKVCVFNEQDIFVAIYHIQGRPELNKVYTPAWGLPAGKYYYTVWLNYHEYMNVDPCSMGSSMRAHTMMQLSVPATKVVDDPSKVPFLCYGHLDNEELDSTHMLVTIPVMQFTNRINLRVTGLTNLTSLRASAADSDEYVFSINDNNSTYGFHGDYTSDEYFKYSTTKRADSDVLNASLTVLKLSGSRRNPTFTIQNRATGEELFPENLTNNLIDVILSQLPDNDFDKNHDYYIEINAGPPQKEITLKITINGWSESTSNEVFDIYK